MSRVPVSCPTGFGVDGPLLLRGLLQSCCHTQVTCGTSTRSKRRRKRLNRAKHNNKLRELRFVLSYSCYARNIFIVSQNFCLSWVYI